MRGSESGRRSAVLEAGLAAVTVGALCVPMVLVLVLWSGGPSLTVSPTSVRPDGWVTLSATGCPVPALVSSQAFDSVMLDPGGRSRVLRIDAVVVPGRYRLDLSCNGRSATAELLVGDGRDGTVLLAGPGGAGPAN